VESGKSRKLLFDALVLVALVFVLLTLTFGSPAHWVEGLTSSGPHVTPEGDTSAGVDMREIAFRLSHRRYIQVVLDTEIPSNVQAVRVNGGRVFTWYAENITLGDITTTRVFVYYPWAVDESYRVEVDVDDGKVWTTATAAPIAVYMNVEVESVVVSPPMRGLAGNVSVHYHINSSGYSNMSMMAFLSGYEQRTLPVYVFYDTNFMPNETLKRADSLVKILSDFEYDVRKLDWIELEDVANNRESCVLVVLNPLMDRNGTEVYDVLPSTITDRNKNGFIRDDSAYKKSYLYDWMLASGMVLITPDSTQPNWNIIYDNGRVEETGDKYGWNDAATMFTSASSGVQRGFGSAGTPYTKLNIENTLGLITWNGKWGFAEDDLKNTSLQCYPYGTFMLRTGGGSSITYLPAFVRTRDGGWLTMGDIVRQSKELWDLKPFDLAMLILHEPWNMQWLEDGWNYDSARVYYPVVGGVLDLTSDITITLPKETVPQGKYTLRLVAIGYNDDNSTYTLIRCTEPITVLPR